MHNTPSSGTLWSRAKRLTNQAAARLRGADLRFRAQARRHRSRSARPLDTAPRPSQRACLALRALPAPPSLGTHIELGWASALGKPMVLLLDPDGEYAGMIHSLGALVPTATIKLTGKSVDFRELERAVFDVTGRARKAA